MSTYLKGVYNVRSTGRVAKTFGPFDIERQMQLTHAKVRQIAMDTSIAPEHRAATKLSVRKVRA